MTTILPPLPPLIGETGTVSVPGGRSMLAVLGEEHRQLADLYARLAAVAGSRRTDGADDRLLGRLTGVFVATLCRHLAAEEEYLFPAVARVLPDGPRLARIEVNADQAIRYALRRLSAGPARDVRGLEELEPALRLHIRRTENKLFPGLAATVSAADLVRLGNRVVIATEAAPTRPHPSLPATPPWNKITDPLAGVVDKVRDALTGRITYREDL
jgi:hypothetical protein